MSREPLLGDRRKTTAHPLRQEQSIWFGLCGRHCVLNSEHGDPRAVLPFRMTHDHNTEAAAPSTQSSRAPADPQHGGAERQHDRGMYLRLALMALVSFVAMYILMYAMVDRFDHVRASINQAYMAALMAAPMVAIELLFMSAMYKSMRANFVALGLSVVVGLGAFVAIRQQTAIGDAEFARSMIPHHAGAILMCQEAKLTDPELQRLCSGPQGIIESQEREIAQLEAFLARK